MRKEALEQIEKINNIDKDIVSKTLLDSLCMFWSLSDIIDHETKFIVTSSRDYFKSNKRYEELRECLYELSESISSSYLDTGYGDSFSCGLLDYLGFDRNDDITTDVIDEYCMVSEKERDMTILKHKLIECVYDIESDKNNF